MTDLNELTRATNTPTNPHTSEHHITVAGLRGILAGLPDDAVIVLAKDAEGNGFSPLSGPVGVYWYRPESTWAGEVHPIGEDADGDVYEPDGDELIAVVLDPTN
ncbi:hypothetical protein [Micromonospora sediminicola]|uniref:hypothetical protein n=1 Tax=Micromonospora sediminicola TaxID=946078 RepID=UPI0037B92FFA